MAVTLEEGLRQDYMPRRRRQEDQIQNLRLAQERARELKSFAIPDRPNWYWVRGHEVQVRDGAVVFCDCKSWQYRSSCKHAERVNIRLGFMGMR